MPGSPTASPLPAYIPPFAYYRKPSPRPNPAVRAYNEYRAKSERPPRSVALDGFLRNNQGLLGNAYVPFVPAPVSDLTIERPGYIPTHKRGRLSGWGEPFSERVNLDTARMQSAISAAERGEMTRFYCICRDFLMGGSHLQTEFSKRKMSVIGQPHSIKPYRAKGPDGKLAKEATAEDKRAAFLIEDMIESVGQSADGNSIASNNGWLRALVHLEEAALYPCAVLEKIFDINEDDTKPWLRYRLKSLDPVNPFLHSYKLAYIAAGGFQLSSNLPNNLGPSPIPSQMFRDGNVIWDPDTWEPDLRFFRTFPNGMIDYSWGAMYAPDPLRHIVHRGNMLSGVIRDNYGGVFRACWFWNYFAQLAKDWFPRAMNKYGHPFPVIEANMSDVNTFNTLKQAFTNAIELGGILVPTGAKVTLETVNSSGMAEGYKILIDACHSELSKLILGHEGASTAKAEGLNSSQEQTVQGASEMIRISDQMFLSETLRVQLFTPYLRINGYGPNYHAPNIVWGGLSEEDATQMSDTIKTAHDAGLQLTDDAIEKYSEVTGMDFERAPEPEPAMAGAGTKNKGGA